MSEADGETDDQGDEAEKQDADEEEDGASAATEVAAVGRHEAIEAIAQSRLGSCRRGYDALLFGSAIEIMRRRRSQNRRGRDALFLLLPQSFLRRS